VSVIDRLILLQVKALQSVAIINGKVGKVANQTKN
jgi:hypothetical protein